MIATLIALSMFVMYIAALMDSATVFLIGVVMTIITSLLSMLTDERGF